DTYKYTYIRDEHVIKPSIEAFQSVNEFEKYKSVEPVMHDRIEEENIEVNTIKIVPSKKDVTETSSTKSKRSSKASLLAPKNSFRHDESNSSNFFNNSLISISPGEEIEFNECDGKNDIIQHIQLKNNSKSSLAYKIKITSPDKFRVKPGTGIIPNSGSVQVMVNFLKDYHLSSNSHKDKFLILWTEVGEKVQTSELNDFWKQASLKKENIQDHKMKCVVKRPDESTVTENSNLSSEKNEIVAPNKASKILGDNVKLKIKPEETKSELNGPILKDETSFMNLKLFNLEKNVFFHLF
ncbi:Motile sperm domain-containing 2, partial [Brachionus plicatilis]